jgi:2-polyprenyl-6-methoxyphenol hydroxylase-like FAD-dependent oxidoreductase
MSSKNSMAGLRRSRRLSPTGIPTLCLALSNALPIKHRWDRVPGVTLLGDAAHLMAPSGEGANLAMFDGAELGKAIAANHSDVEAALIAYEKDLFPRNASEAADAEEVLDVCLGSNAPQSLLNFFTNHSPAK